MRGNLTCACSAIYPRRKTSTRSCRSRSCMLIVGGTSQFSESAELSCSYPVRGVGLNHPLPLARSSSSLIPLRSRSITYLSILSVALGELSCLALCSKALFRRLCCRSRRLRSLICSYDSIVPFTRMYDAALAGLSSRPPPSTWLWPSMRKISGLVSGCCLRSSTRIASSSLSPFPSGPGAQSYKLC